MNKEEITKQTYSKIAQLWSNKHPNEYFWQDELDYLKQLKPSGSLIDVGCGPGRDSTMLAGAGYDYLGVDYSEGMIAVARQNHPETKFEIGDMYDLSDFGTFDVVWAIASVLHIEKKNVDKVLASLCAAVVDNGVAVIAMKQGDSEDIEIFDDGSKRLMVYWPEPAFRSHLEKAGFRVETVLNKETDEFHWMTFYLKKSK